MAPARVLRQSADATLTESVNSLKSDLSSLKEEVASGKMRRSRYKIDSIKETEPYNGVPYYTYKVTYVLCEGKAFPQRSNIVSWHFVADSSIRRQTPLQMAPYYFSNGGKLEFLISYEDYQRYKSDPSNLSSFVYDYIDIYYLDNILTCG